MTRMIHRAGALLLVLPSLIVLITPRLSSLPPLPGPSTASAMPDPTSGDAIAPDPTPQRTTITASQRAAIAHLSTIANDTPSNPFHYPEPMHARQDPYASTTPTEEATPDAAAPIVPPTLIVSSMASARGRNIAFISGTLRHEGDPVADGWTIERIDPIDRAVTIRHESGATHTIAQKR